MSFIDELEKILKDMLDHADRCTKKPDSTLFASQKIMVMQEAITSIINLFDKEVIGEDEQHQFWCNSAGNSICDCGAISNNDLRAEQRAKLRGDK